jgi:DNA-binding NarL/FixJ family response regulator
MQPNFWNQLISCLTGGMLYGREVQKPPSFQPHRQRTRIRQLNRAAPRRRQVLTRILNGWSVQQICRDLQMNYHVVHNHISHLCREEDVPDRHALVAKLGGSKSPPFNQIERAGIRRFRVQELLLQGCTYKQIMQKLDIDFPTINRDTQTIYKLHGVSGGGQKARRALAAKLGLHFTTPNDLLRQQILNLLLSGQTPTNTARHLNISFNSIRKHIRVLCRHHAVPNRHELLAKLQTPDTAAKTSNAPPSASIASTAPPPKPASAASPRNSMCN